MKHLLPLLALGWLPLAATAQTTPPVWSRAMPLTTGAGAAFTPVLAADATGNTYVAGAFAQTIVLGPGTTLTSQGGTDGYLAKYSPTGTLLWARQLAGTGNDFFESLVADASGNLSLLAAAGSGAQLGTLTFTPSGFGTSLALARLDAQGQPQGLTELANGSLLGAASLARDPGGDLYFSAYFALDVTVGGTSLSTPFTTTGYGLDQLVARVSPTGTLRWVKQGGRVNVTSGVYTPLFVSHLAADAGGLYFNWTCNGNAGGFGTFALPTGLGDYDGLVIKLDGQGTPQWAKRVGGTGADVSTFAQLDATGRLVVPGFTAPAGYFANPATVNNNIPSTGFLTVLEPTAGAPAWTAQLAATSAGAFRDLTSDAGGNLYVTGNFAGQGSVGGTALSSAGGIDALVVSFTPAGAVRWVQKSGGSGDEGTAAIVLNGSSGGLTLTGGFTGQAQFGSSTFNGTSSNGVALPFVAQLAASLPTRAAAAAAPLACYPNPAAATGTLALPALPAGTELTLTDATGRLVHRLPAAPTLPLAGLAPGLYLAQAQAPDGTRWSTRLVVE